MSDDGSRLGILREIREDELEMMLAWRNEPATRSKMYTRHKISLPEHLAWWARIQQSDSHIYFMYEYRGAPSGIVGFTQIDRVNRNASWGFYAAPDAARGTGSRMEFLALEKVFGPLGLHRLHGEVLAFNSVAIRLHQKFGFKTEGILREHHFVDGEFVDVHRIGLLASEWAEKREEMRSKLERLAAG